MNLNREKPVLAMHRIVKSFGGVRALGGANLNVQAGTIHGLVGQNGAGKSTLIKILAGIHQPDAGSIEIAGQAYNHLTPHRAEKLGLHFIHQERLLVPTFTVGEALFLGNEPGVGPLPLLNRRRMKRQAAETIHHYFGVELPVGALIGELTPDSGGRACRRISERPRGGRLRYPAPDRNAFRDEYLCRVRTCTYAEHRHSRDIATAFLLDRQRAVGSLLPRLASTCRLLYWNHTSCGRPPERNWDCPGSALAEHRNQRTTVNRLELLLAASRDRRVDLSSASS
jgi:ABC-type Fe3+/spermidine/putrescine transport system ATPase subunit